ncbi:MAG: class I SAM-dependent methyltransferase [Chlamydiia bacterium]|nr:class I SAM-dependent methyltransferase [Chlamydiia bacterium]
MNVIKDGDAGGANPLLARQREAEAHFERAWLKDPDQFNPAGKPEEEIRVERTVKLIEDHFPKEGISIVDLGSGFAPVARALAEKGRAVLCTDIASGALQHIPEDPHLTKEKQGLPSTTLDDSRYDLCLALEVIAELDRRDLRLAVAELCRIIKNDGRVVLSSALDINSEDALERLVNVLETEFKIERLERIHLVWYLRLHRFLSGPARGMKRSLLLKLFCAPLALLFAPLLFLLKKRATVNFLERFCRFVSREKGTSLVILVCKRRPLLEEKHEPALPDRAPFRREVRWE